MSRALYASLIPADRAGEFFGFYNMLTKFAHILGPLLVFIGTLISDAPQIILAILLPVFISGGVVLTRVKEGEMS